MSETYVFPIEAYRQGIEEERERIKELIQRQICFDALADEDGRCVHHGGKCYELRLLINTITPAREKDPQ
jgi:hypothetical protein